MKKFCHSLLSVSLLVFVPEAFASPFTEIERNNDDTNTKVDEIVDNYLESEETLITERVVVDNETMIAEQVLNKKMKLMLRKMKRKMLSKLELTLVRCCSSNMDRDVHRCFEVNGFGGINFLKEPCEHLDNVLKKRKN